MLFYTLRAAAQKLGLSHETIRQRLQALKSQGLESPKLKLDKCQEWEIIAESALPALRERQNASSTAQRQNDLTCQDASYHPTED